jgi:tetratricopeptide (TPR) repeat protein
VRLFAAGPWLGAVIGAGIGWGTVWPVYRRIRHLGARAEVEDFVEDPIAVLSHLKPDTNEEIPAWAKGGHILALFLSWPSYAVVVAPLILLWGVVGMFQSIFARLELRLAGIAPFNHGKLLKAATARALLRESGEGFNLNGYRFVHPLVMEYFADYRAVVRGLNEDAARFRAEGRHRESEILFRRALGLQEEKTPQPDPDVLATTIQSLAEVLLAQRKFGAALPLFERALTLTRASDSTPPALAHILKGIAQLNEAEGRYAQAEVYCRELLAVTERSHGPEHVEAGRVLALLANLGCLRGNCVEAEPLCRKALAILEAPGGTESIEVANALVGLANVLSRLGKFVEAEDLYDRALTISESALGPGSLRVGIILNNLAKLKNLEGNPAEARELFQIALSIVEAAVGPDHLDTALVLSDLSRLCISSGNHTEAEALCKRALAIREKWLNSDHPDLVRSRETLAELCRVRDMRPETPATGATS